jgi:hypothetical protein
MKFILQYDRNYRQKLLLYTTHHPIRLPHTISPTQCVPIIACTLSLFWKLLYLNAKLRVFKSRPLHKFGLCTFNPLENTKVEYMIKFNKSVINFIEKWNVLKNLNVILM